MVRMTINVTILGIAASFVLGLMVYAVLTTRDWLRAYKLHKLCWDTVRYAFVNLEKIDPRPKATGDHIPLASDIVSAWSSGLINGDDALVLQRVRTGSADALRTVCFQAEEFNEWMLEMKRRSDVWTRLMNMQASITVEDIDRSRLLAEADAVSANGIDCDAQEAARFFGVRD